MASQMVIPASNDTLFIRGFSSRHHIDEIRDFFSHEGGRNTVEFFKESLTGDQLFIALKFESKSIAKDVLNRFDGYEVMGDRISLSWYKDVRKARGYDGGNYRRGGGGQQWPADRYDYRQGGGGNYNRGGRDNRTGSYRGGNQRSGWYPRGSDYSEGGGSRSRRYTRSSSRSQSRSPSARSRSHSASRSSSRDDRGSRSHSDSRERTRKRRRSASDASNHGRRSGHNTKTGTKGRGSSSSASPDASHSESDSLPPPASDNKKTKNRVKKSSASGSLDRRTPSATRDIKAKELNVSGGGVTIDGEVEGSDGQEFVGEDMSSPPQPVPPPPPGGAAAAASKASRAALRSAVTTVPGGKKSKAATAAALDDSAVEAANMPPADSSSLPPSAGRKPPGESSIGGPPGAAAGTKTKKKDRRVPTDEITDDDIFAAQTRKPPRNETDEFLQQYERQKHDNDPTGDYMYDDNGPPAPVGAPGKRKIAAGGKKMKPAGEFDPFDEDEDAMMAELGGKRRRPDEPSRGAGRAGAGGKRMPPGAVGLSYEKMQMVRQKKEEIEKAYRQDCETFATVTKMLISKEPSLEEKIQNSLRENLKDIGHRCIQELRDFIERLKDEDLDDV